MKYMGKDVVLILGCIRACSQCEVLVDVQLSWTPYNHTRDETQQLDEFHSGKLN